MEKRSPSWPQGVNVKSRPALQQALDAMAGVNAVAAANKGGCQYEAGGITVPFFNRIYRVRVPDVHVEEIGVASAPLPDVQLVILHYLLNADGTPPAGMWVTFRHTPDGMIFEPRFNAMAIEPLLRAFGSDIAGFSKAAQALGGTRMTRTGDASYRFMALPQIPMGVTLYLADEEMAASASILFDAVAANYLWAEDLAFLGIHFSESLLKAR